MGFKRMNDVSSGDPGRAAGTFVAACLLASVAVCGGPAPDAGIAAPKGVPPANVCATRPGPMSVDDTAGPSEIALDISLDAAGGIVMAGAPANASEVTARMLALRTCPGNVPIRVMFESADRTPRDAVEEALTALRQGGMRESEFFVIHRARHK